MTPAVKLQFRDLLLSVYLPSVLMSIGQMALVVILPLYMISRGDSLSTAALVFAMRSVGSTLINLPASAAIARFGIRAGMLCGISMIGIGALLVALADSSLLIAGATLIFGAGMGTWLLSRLAFITRHVAARERGRSMSTLAGIQRLGLLIGPFVGGLSAASLGFRWVFFFIMCCALLNLALVMLFSSAGRADRRQGQTVLPSQSNLFTLLPRILYRHRQIFLGAGVFVFCLQMVREQRHLLITLWGAFIGLDTGVIGAVVSGAAMLDLAMFPIAGYVMDHHGRKLAGIICIVILAIALGLLRLTDTFALYLAVVLLAAFGNGLGSGIMLTLGSDFAPEQDSSQFLGVWRIFSDMGSFSGPALTSLCASLSLALGLSAIIGVVGALALCFRVAETLPANPATLPRDAE
ncbi:MAG: MFS transporter [Pseudohongiellaceae bacterium]